MKNVTDRVSNPFGMRPDCDRFVAGYGDANADFHVVGDHPGVHGGADTGVPFTGTPAAERLQDALVRAGLLEAAGDQPTVGSTYLSYLHMCVPDGDRVGDDGEPTAASYGDMERFFDAELRAIAAHVLVPVGERATRHVLENYTARAHKTDVDMEALHGRELLGSGWLVLPVRDPAEWVEGSDVDAPDRDRAVGADGGASGAGSVEGGSGEGGSGEGGSDGAGSDGAGSAAGGAGHADRLVDALLTLQSTDYSREADLGRFLPGGDPYRVR